MIDALELTALPASAQALRPAVREFLAQELAGRAPDVLARSWSAFDRGFSQRMAARGWVGLTLPVEYGGAGKSAFDRFVLVEEMLAAGAPVFAHWVADRQSGPLILKYGSEAQRRFYLPRICRAEAAFCIGMSEPQSGSDLASIRTRATPQRGGGWLPVAARRSGPRTPSTAQYMIALVRTSGHHRADRHARPVSADHRHAAAGHHGAARFEDLTGDRHFSEVFFDDVELLDAEALVGEEGAGWAQVTAELAYERSGPGAAVFASFVLLRGLARPTCARTGAAQTTAALRAGGAPGRSHLRVLRSPCRIAVTARVIVRRREPRSPRPRW